MRDTSPSNPSADCTVSTPAPAESPSPTARAARPGGVVAFVGPVIRITPTGRALWAVVGAGCLTVLAIALWLTPDDRGFGTHELLTGTPCPFPLIMKLPCPTCGMTTAFALTMHARPIEAFLAQPAGFVLCLSTVALLIVSIRIVATGTIRTIDWSRIRPAPVALSLALFLVGAWAFKLVQAWIYGMPGRG